VAVEVGRVVEFVVGIEVVRPVAVVDVAGMGWGIAAVAALGQVAAAVAAEEIVAAACIAVAAVAGVKA
jgi:hypothetical protein